MTSATVRHFHSDEEVRDGGGRSAPAEGFDVLWVDGIVGPKSWAAIGS